MEIIFETVFSLRLHQVNFILCKLMLSQDMTRLMSNRNGTICIRPLAIQGTDFDIEYL